MICQGCIWAMSVGPEKRVMLQGSEKQAMSLGPKKQTI